MKNSERESLLVCLRIGLLLCAWLSPGLSSAGQLTVPNTYTDGDTLTASSLNGNFDEVETQVTDNANDIAAMANSLSSIKQGDLSLLTVISSTDSANSTEVTSLTITSPIGGHVYVVASGQIGIEQDAAEYNWVSASISTSIQHDFSNDTVLIVDTTRDSDPANRDPIRNWVPLHINRLEPVDAGVGKTLYLTAYRDSTGSNSAFVSGARLTVMFFPALLP